MWFYLGIFTTVIALIIRWHQKTLLQSPLQDRKKNLIPVSGKYAFEWQAGDKECSYGFLEIACASGIQFSARLERGFDKWSKFVGLCYECQTGDPQFDERVYLSCITENDADWIGLQPSLQQHIISALQQSAAQASIHPKSELMSDGNSLFLKLAIPLKANLDKEAFILEKLPILQAIADNLRQQPAHQPHFWKVPNQRHAAIVLALSSSLAVVGGLEFFRFFGFHDNALLHPWQLAPYAALIGISGALLLLGYGLHQVKKCARRHLMVAEICLFGLPGLCFASYGWLYDANLRLDHAHPEIHMMTVIDKYTMTHRYKNSSYHTYHVQLSPDTPPIPASLSISSRIYQRLEINKTVKVIIQPGFLAQPWLLDIQ